MPASKVRVPLALSVVDQVAPRTAVPLSSTVTPPIVGALTVAYAVTGARASTMRTVSARASVL
ncbi:hypothetical protein FACS18949_06000 [Clostridia bacterium]|nr:hypothetical protein FACS18949_06000 [Clostridia bacterium]